MSEFVEANPNQSKFSQVKNLVQQKVNFAWKKLKGLSKKEKWIVSSGMAIMLVCVSTLSVIYVHKSTIQHSLNPAQIAQLDKLNSLEGQLQLLTNKFNNSQHPSQQETEYFRQQLSHIENAITQLQQQLGLHKLQKLVVSSSAHLGKQIGQLQSNVELIKRYVVPMPCSTNTNLLPFTVVGVDVWNGQEKASVKSKQGDDFAPPMGLHESKDGWTLTHLQFSPAQAVFQNSRGVCVKVNV